MDWRRQHSTARCEDRKRLRHWSGKCRYSFCAGRLRCCWESMQGYQAFLTSTAGGRRGRRRIRKRPSFHGGTFDLLMVKVIHDNRRFVERPVHGIVIAQVRQPPFFRQLPYCCVQSFPVAAAAFLVNFPIEGHQVRIAFVDVLQNYGFVAAPQIQVFQPDQVAFVFSLLHNRRNIRNARKMGEMKQVVRIPASWKAFMAASLREMLTAMSISA